MKECLRSLVALMVISLFTGSVIAQEQIAEVRNAKVKISFGQSGQLRTQKEVNLKSAVPGVVISNLKGKELESNDRVEKEALLNYGAGDVDELITEVSWRKPTAALRKINESADMWRYLMKHGSPGQVERLSKDPWNIPDAPLITVQLDKTGTEGFSFSLDQLLNHGAMWLPEHDIFLTNAENPVDFNQHINSLEGQRTLEHIKSGPDASLKQFRQLWKDFGNPLIYDVPWQTKYMGTTGHLTITAAAHGSVYKFAVDRWGNVRPDYASPHRFRLNSIWEESKWKSQEIENGLPVIITKLEKNGQTLEMEQFASPLGDLEAAIRGYIPGVFFTKVKITGKAGSVDYKVSLNNEVKDQEMELKKFRDNWIVTDRQTGDILLMLETGNRLTVDLNTEESGEKGRQVILNITGELKKGQSGEIFLKLPSPPIAGSRAAGLEEIKFSAAKNQTVNYWNDRIGHGAHFQVPEEEVNELFRANLWHALVLPRHTIGSKGEQHMDLPYANTAYGQENSDWPINQGVYVDYMIYGLRGYEEVAFNEIRSMFQTQQQADGRIGGYADWGVYSPGHLYTIAQNYLLSGNRKIFDQLLPNSLKTLDWCLAQIAESNSKENGTGLILGGLNDLSHGERAWAFTQAYYVAGLELFGKALSAYNHPRAEEVKQISAKMKKDVVKEFARSSVKSPVVQLADGTWINYVPTDALTPRRMLDEWYPTDVDTGPLHLSRMGVFEPYSWLTTAMLNDHEDNLFLNNKGAANEPVYVQQANAYLLRDEPKAVIRSFYSLMACGFSHGQYSPLEHRWAHGQYYGPPSTDGAWFEIYRKMLLNEFGDDNLIIGQAIPRAWLENGKQINVKNAPSYFGDVSFTIDGESSKNEIVATVELSDRNPPKELVVRFRHPDEKPIRSVIVNGEIWKNFDVEKEYIRIPKPVENKYVISASY